MERKKGVRAVNKKITDKKATLPDTFVELGRNVYARFAERLNAEMDKHGGGNVSEISDPTLANNSNLVYWKRRIKARYNESRKLWEPVDERIETDGSYMLYFAPKDIEKEGEGIRDLVKGLKLRAKELGSSRTPHIFIMVEGWRNYKKNRDLKRQMDRLFIQLSLTEKCNVIEVDNIAQAITWLFNVTADLGEWSLFISFASTDAFPGVREHK